MSGGVTSSTASLPCSSLVEIVNFAKKPENQVCLPVDACNNYIIPKVLVNGSKDIRIGLTKSKVLVVDMADVIESIKGISRHASHVLIGSDAWQQKNVVNLVQQDLPAGEGMFLSVSVS